LDGPGGLPWVFRLVFWLGLVSPGFLIGLASVDGAHDVARSKGFSGQKYMNYATIYEFERLHQISSTITVDHSLPLCPTTVYLNTKVK
jgi:hypothetical protein